LYNCWLQHALTASPPVVCNKAEKRGSEFPGQWRGPRAGPGQDQEQDQPKPSRDTRRNWSRQKAQLGLIVGCGRGRWLGKLPTAVAAVRTSRSFSLAKTPGKVKFKAHKRLDWSKERQGDGTSWATRKLASKEMPEMAANFFPST